MCTVHFPLLVCAPMHGPTGLLLRILYDRVDFAATVELGSSQIVIHTRLNNLIRLRSVRTQNLRNSMD